MLIIVKQCLQIIVSTSRYANDPVENKISKIFSMISKSLVVVVDFSPSSHNLSSKQNYTDLRIEDSSGFQVPKNRIFISISLVFVVLTIIRNQPVV